MEKRPLCKGVCRWAAACAVAGIVCAQAGAAVIYVDDSATGGGNNGNSWRNAFVDLQPALAIAHAGDEIRIAQGMYKPAPPNGPRSATFQAPSGATLAGGYAGLGALDPDANDPSLYVTTLSGDLNGNSIGSAYHVVTLDAVSPRTVLRGLRVTGGRANNDASPDGRGAGLLLLNGAAPLIEQCTIELNQAAHGAGIYAQFSAPRMVNSTVNNNAGFEGSTDNEGGGGIFGPGSIITGCTFTTNHESSFGSALRGTGIAISTSTFVGNGTPGFNNATGTVNVIDSTISDCTFNGNYAFLSGGSLSLVNCVVRNCTFQAGYSQGGGAIYNMSNSASLVENCTFTSVQSFIGAVANGNVQGNSRLTLLHCHFNSMPIGGALHNSGQCVAIGCRFTGNTPAVFQTYSGHLEVIDCLFFGNSLNAINGQGSLVLVNSSVVATFGVAGSESAVHCSNMIVRNSILWQNGNGSEGNQVSASGSLSISNSIIQGWTGSLGGPNNSGANPLLIDNARLSAGSPARDSGDNAALPPDTYDLDHDGNTIEPLPYDLDTHRRIVNGTIDRGCYEFQTCPGDIAPLAEQGDGHVSVDDLLAVIDSWGACPSPCPADIVHNQRVDVDDVLAVILGWGACP